jgi:hypothetical protein
MAGIIKRKVLLFSLVHYFVICFLVPENQGVHNSNLCQHTIMTEEVCGFLWSEQAIPLIMAYFMGVHSIKSEIRTWILCYKG